MTTSSACAARHVDLEALSRGRRASHGERLRVRIEVTSFEGVRNMKLARVSASAMLPEGSVVPYAHAGAFSVVEIDEPWSLRPLLIIARNLRHPALARTHLLADHLKTEQRKEAGAAAIGAARPCQSARKPEREVTQRRPHSHLILEA